FALQLGQPSDRFVRRLVPDVKGHRPPSLDWSWFQSRLGGHDDPVKSPGSARAVSRVVALVLRGLLARLLVCGMAADQAAGGRPKHPMVAGIMTGDTTDQAPLIQPAASAGPAENPASAISKPAAMT